VDIKIIGGKTKKTEKEKDNKGKIITRAANKKG